MIDLNNSINNLTCVKISNELSAIGVSDNVTIANSLFTDFLTRTPQKNHSRDWFVRETQLIKGRIRQFIPKISEVSLEFLCRKIARIEKSFYHVEASSQFSKKETPIPIAIFSDFDGVDHNGAIISFLEEAFLHGYPCITSRTLFTNTLQAPNVKKRKTMSADLLRLIDKKYLIFTNGPFLVFLPVTFNPYLSLEQRLWRLDLAPERLTQISIKETQVCEREYSSVDLFKALFSDRSAYDKLFWIAGHGGSDSPAGLLPENYSKLLDWMNNHRCKGLIVTSCLSGGHSSLLHLPHVSFPVILRSIGDFPTTGIVRTGMETSKSTELLQHFSESTAKAGTGIQRDIRRLIALEEVNSSTVTPNSVQVYVPSSPGFRTIPHTNNVVALTHTKYQTFRLRREIISVPEVLQVFLLVVELPIKFTSSAPIFLSMIPGTSNHFFSEIITEKTTPKEFLKGVFATHKNWTLEVVKVFFIAKLSSSATIWHQVFVDLKTGEYGYREGDGYYFGNLNNDDAPTKISGSSYFLLWSEAKASSTPAVKAVQAATAGQQTQNQVDLALTGSSFWGDRLIDWQEYAPFLDREKIKLTEIDVLSTKTRDWNLSERDVAHLVAYIVHHNESLACAYLERSNISPSLTDLSGYPLIIHAARDNHIEFLRLLLKLKVDVNQKNASTGNTALVLALQRKSKAFIKLLLDQEAIDVNIRNLSGVAVFASAGADKELFEMCRISQGKLNFDLDGTTTLGPLARAFIAGDIQQVEMYVEAGANLNVLSEGELLLCHALMISPQLVDKLLKMGANPYEEVDKATIPILYGIEHSSSDIVDRMLEIELPQSNREKMARMIFLAALRSGNEKKIRAAMKLKPMLLSNDVDHYKHSNDPFNFCPCRDEQSSLVEGFKKLVLFGHDDLLKELCCNGLINLGLIFTLIKKEKIDQEWRLILIKKILELISDPNQGLQIALEVNPAELNIQPYLLDFVDKGANVNAYVEAPYTTRFAKIVALGSVEVIKLSLERGATVFSFNPDSDAIDAWKAGQQRTQNQAEIQSLLQQYGEIQARQLLETAKHLPDKNQALQYIIMFDQELVDREPYIRQCVEAGGDLNTPMERNFETVFAGVVRFGSIVFLEWCLNHNAKVYPQALSCNEQPMQAVSHRKKDQEAANELLNRFGKMEMQNSIGVMLDQAIANSNINFLTVYVAQNLQYLCNKGTMPLIFGAIASKKPEVVAAVLKNKAYLDSTYNGQSPLEFARTIGDSKIIELCLSGD